MKTTLELPDSLVFEIKLRALREGRRLKDVVAELLEKGLAEASASEMLARPVLETDELTGLPIVRAGHPAAPGEELTPERLKDILLAEDMARYAGSR